MAKIGRPPLLKEEHMRRIEKMARAGFTDVEMSDTLNVTERTFNNWKHQNPEFFQSLTDWKNYAHENVMKALYHRAIGFKTYEDKVLSFNGEHTDTVRIEKNYPPDTAAAFIWLKNREPENWKDRTESVNVNIDAAKYLTREQRKEAILQMMENRRERLTDSGYDG